ncbi:hypothetical protein B0O99DRAFT_685866 [Bisporella sp. PMI_857]|nr:hypothetical protein B0O99DRAFT_685866 [Bisporella sp. PMI_857]
MPLLGHMVSRKGNVPADNASEIDSHEINDSAANAAEESQQVLQPAGGHPAVADVHSGTDTFAAGGSASTEEQRETAFEKFEQDMEYIGTELSVSLFLPSMGLDTANIALPALNRQAGGYIGFGYPGPSTGTAFSGNHRRQSRAQRRLKHPGAFNGTAISSLGGRRLALPLRPTQLLQHHEPPDPSQRSPYTILPRRMAAPDNPLSTRLNGLSTQGAASWSQSRIVFRTERLTAQERDDLQQRSVIQYLGYGVPTPYRWHPPTQQEMDKTAAEFGPTWDLLAEAMRTGSV